MSNRLVIFDLDNTLVITTPAAKNAYKQAINYIAKQHGMLNARFKLYNHWKKIVQKLKNSNNPFEREFKYSLGLLLEEHKIPETYLSQALSIYKKELLNRIELQRGVKELFSWLRENGIFVTVSTESMKSAAKQKLKAVGLLKSVDFLVSANDVGVMKPNADYYNLVLEETGVAKKSVVVVGDQEVQDIEPARSLGIKAIQVPPNNFHLNTIKAEISEYFDIDK